MRRVAVLLGLFAFGVCWASSAVAVTTVRHWVWTESYAEKRVAATIRYRDTSGSAAYQQGLQEREANVADAKAQLQQAEASGDQTAILNAKATLATAEHSIYAWKSDFTNAPGGVVTYAPTDVLCTGIGSAVRGIRFSKFRCVVTFGLTAHIHVLATVTGRTTFRWRVI
jgi:hypothetical protein